MDAIPKGGGIADGIKFLSDPASIKASAQLAQEWVADAIKAVRLAAEPNPWKDATDEQIAEEIVRQVNERKIRSWITPP